MATESRRDAAAASGERRTFLGAFSSIFMCSGLASGYGAFLAFAGRFLFPAHASTKAWQFVATLDQLTVGASLPYRMPSGAEIVVARQGAGEEAEDFIALSSVCPHLGCAVHWESQNDRFFCPCHNGVFDASGKATAGPPAAANQSLKRFPLKVENGLLYILASTDSLTGKQES